MISRLLEKAYRSNLGRIMSPVARLWSKLGQPKMIYGYVDKTTQIFRKYTRISNTVTIMCPEKLSMGDNVWVWHYSILDASEGLNIGEGCQIGAWVGIFTHSSHNAIRLYGQRFVHVPARERLGYIRGSVIIGEYTFVGAGSLIFPGVEIGKGCIVSAGTIITKNVPDYSVIQGVPGKIVGDTRQIDKDFLERHPDLKEYYFER